MTNSVQKIFERKIENALPRVLSTLDREFNSKTFGCADRLFWCWKFIDFPGARFQEIAYTLSSILSIPDLNTANIDTSALQDWLDATFKFWKKLQHSDGSFDEAYPLERSLAATSFTGFYVGQAYLDVLANFSQSDFVDLRPTFEKLGNWLCNNDETHGFLSNHLAASAAALFTIYRITGTETFRLRSQYFVEKIISKQSKEGWYTEYNGSDPGYESHTIFYLATIWQETKDDGLLQSLRKSIHFISHFIHPDGSIGGIYGSRNTKFFMPAGFVLLAEKDRLAAAIAQFMAESIKAQNSINLDHMDAQNVLPILNNYICLLRHKPKSKLYKNSNILPFKRDMYEYFEESGQIIYSNKNYYAIVATSKGGVVYACSKTKSANSMLDSGATLKLRNGKYATTQALRSDNKVSISDGSVSIKVEFVETNQMLQSLIKFLILRLISLLSALSPTVSVKLKLVLARVLILRKKAISETTHRLIKFGINSVSISDTFEPRNYKNLSEISFGGNFSSIHMGSSRYFNANETSNYDMKCSRPIKNDSQIYWSRLWEA